MTFEHDPFEAGLAFAVKVSPDYLGREAVEKRSQSVERRLTCLTLDDPAAVVLGREPVFSGTECAGYVTSAAYGYTIGRGIAYAWLPAELAEVGNGLVIRYFDQDVSATVAAEPLFDPAMNRVRS